MTNAIQHILEPYLLRLPDLRGIPSLWSEFKCIAATDNDGKFTDSNHQQRNNLLVALFYDQRASDENLLRYLVKQEIEMHRQLPSPAVYESLKIGFGLLARFRNTSNIELFIDAKNANLATQATFDAVSFVSPGPWRSYDHLHNLDEQHKTAFIENVGATLDECNYTDEQASDWIDQQTDLLPGPIDKLTLEHEIHLADLLAETSVRNQKVADWIGSIKKWDKEHYLTLYNYEVLRGNIRGQIDALKKIGTYEADKTPAKQMNFYQVAGLYLKLKNTKEAYNNICASVNNYDAPAMEWETCHMYVNCFLDIILAIKDRNDSNCMESFKWIKQYLDHQPWTDRWDIKIIPKIMTASTTVGDNDTMKKFSELFVIRRKEYNEKLLR